MDAIHFKYKALPFIIRILQDCEMDFDEQADYEDHQMNVDDLGAIYAYRKVIDMLKTMSDDKPFSDNVGELDLCELMDLSHDFNTSMLKYNLELTMKFTNEDYYEEDDNPQELIEAYKRVLKDHMLDDEYIEYIKSIEENDDE